MIAFFTSPRRHGGSGPRWIVVTIRHGAHKGSRRSIPVFRRWRRRPFAKAGVQHG